MSCKTSDSSNGNEPKLVVVPPETVRHRAMPPDNCRLYHVCSRRVFDDTGPNGMNLTPPDRASARG